MDNRRTTHHPPDSMQLFSVSLCNTHAEHREDKFISKKREKKKYTETHWEQHIEFIHILARFSLSLDNRICVASTALVRCEFWHVTPTPRSHQLPPKTLTCGCADWRTAWRIPQRIKAMRTLTHFHLIRFVRVWNGLKEQLSSKHSTPFRYTSETSSLKAD